MAAAVDADSYSIHGRPIRPLPKRRLREKLSDDEAIALFASPPHSPNPAPLFRFPFPGYSDYSAGTSEAYSGASSAEIPGTEADDQSDDEDRDGVSFCQPPSQAETPVDGLGGIHGDGYETSENTNNKKKRKVPSGIGAGGASGNGTGSSVSSQCSGFSPNGPSNATRGRYRGYGSSPRSPLAAVPSGRRAIRRIRPQRLFARPDALQDDKENYQQESDEMVPKASSFDFEYPSPISCPPPPPLHRMPPANYQKSMSTVGTQTSPSISNYNASYSPTPQSSVPAAPQKKKAPRRTRPRRPVNYLRDQPANNNGETWICEFCEYESIFGEAPEALMRQYDIKDRRERKKLMEKRRLLEKVKQKGRQKKAASKKSAAAANAHANQAAPPPPPPPSSTDSQGTQSEDFDPGDGTEHRCEGEHEHVCEMHRQEHERVTKGDGRPRGNTGGGGPVAAK